MRDPALDDDSDTVWTQIAELFVRGQSYTDFRLDRLDRNVATLQTDVAELKTDVAELKTDVAELKTDVAELKTDVTELSTRVDRQELANERRHNEVMARLEPLTAFIARQELKADQVSDDD
jgi:chromosome segregation ATPase